MYKHLDFVLAAVIAIATITVAIGADNLFFGIATFFSLVAVTLPLLLILKK